MESHKLGNPHWPIRVLKLLIINFLYLLSFTRSYNLDIDHYLNFTGSNGSLFGYSVLLHKHENETWVLVGAPIANSGFYTNTRNPGAIFKCKITDGTSCEEIHIGIQSDMKCGKTCYSEIDNQWLGVSMSRQQGDGSVLICGHRWKNIYFSKGGNQDKLPHGLCYKFQADLRQSNRFIPCYRDFKKKYAEEYTSCQAGTSNFLMEGLIVMGAPGTAYWTGSVLVYNTSSEMLSVYLDEDGPVRYGSYLGYSVGAGHFSNPESTEVVGGAPRYEQIGKAFIFKIESKNLEVIFQAEGKKLGSYFGAAVCAVDLNSDGLSDLLVGAPMYSTIREEGRVHIYMNDGAGNMREEKFVLVGSDVYAARFGETITNLGDIDDDGYPDVAVGAPQEDDLRGAIYIYNGGRRGISQIFSQRINGAVLGNTFKMFGQSVSGGIDVDGNGFPDIAVGAFLSDSVVVLRTRAVVVVDALLLLPPSMNRSQTLCSENGQPAACIEVKVCFKVQGRRISGEIGLLYNLTADVQHIKASSSRFYFTGNRVSDTTAGLVKAKPESLACVTHKAFMRGWGGGPAMGSSYNIGFQFHHGLEFFVRDVRDIFTPILFELNYELGEHRVPKKGSRTFPALKPILQRREKESNKVANQTEFSRYCGWVNCSTNLRVSASLVLPQSHKNMPYFALGNTKMVMLNVTLVNAGDDAFLPRLHLRFPSNLYFIKVLDVERKYVSCEITEEDSAVVGLDCRVGNLFMNSLAKHTFSFLLDVDHGSNAEDLSITVYGTWYGVQLPRIASVYNDRSDYVLMHIFDSFENEDLLHDNVANLELPLRYGVNLTIHGFVTPSAFIFGHKKIIGGFTEKFNFTFKVMNVGPSKALGAKVEIAIPRYMVPYPGLLLNILDVQTSLGSCYIKNSTYVTEEYYYMPKPYLFEYLVFSPLEQKERHMYCITNDPSCLYVMCTLGNMDVGKVATALVAVEMDPTVLQIYTGRPPIAIECSAVPSPREGPFVLDLHDKKGASVVLWTRDSQMSLRQRAYIILVGLFTGHITLALLVCFLKKVGFFKREKPTIEQDSWDFVPQKKS